ncbi:hypothetical protein GGX14DRAFT_654979 [Mycena pura]|uniref:Uncharacterized protein n=1 Tax=Mycena pura TaxID=153505 RepID=A0AAD6V7D1_9AGAR|nr:hypothetical protein GGX14DRAFT_654979 [Mycena pura]
MTGDSAPPETELQSRRRHMRTASAQPEGQKAESAVCGAAATVMVQSPRNRIRVRGRPLCLIHCHLPAGPPNIAHFDARGNWRHGGFLLEACISDSQEQQEGTGSCTAISRAARIWMIMISFSPYLPTLSVPLIYAMTATLDEHGILILTRDAGVERRQSPGWGLGALAHSAMSGDGTLVPLVPTFTVTSTPQAAGKASRASWRRRHRQTDRRASEAFQNNPGQTTAAPTDGANMYVRAKLWDNSPAISRSPAIASSLSSGTPGPSFPSSTLVSALNLPGPTSGLSSTASATTGLPSSQPGPPHAINGGAIAGGLVGVVVVLGAGTLFLYRRLQRSRATRVSTTPTAYPLTVTERGQSVSTIEQPLIARSAENLSKISGRHRRSQELNRSCGDESGDQSAADSATGGAAFETQMRAMADSVALIATHWQMRAEEEPPGYTTV